MEKFQNKYRIPSARLQNWDYGSHAGYFITICTHHRIGYFGEMIETPCMASPQHQHIQTMDADANQPKNQFQTFRRMMLLSEIGKIVESEWLKTFDLRPDMNLTMGAFVVMPNHFHAIIGIGENQYNTGCRDAMHGVSTPTTFGPQSKNLASVIRGFKSAVTMAARKINPEFQWQSRYYDHIIRDENSFQKISDYIIHNPENWKDDTFTINDNQ